jgi:hypothetical protein
MKNYQADDCLAARHSIGVLAIAQFTAIIADRRSQPRHSSTETVRAGKYLYFSRSSLRIPEANRTGGKSDPLEPADQHCRRE